MFSSLNLRPLAPAFLAACTSAGAQVALPVTPEQAAEEGLRRQQDRARELELRVKPRADVLSSRPRGASPPTLPEETPCLPLAEIQLEGPDATRFHWLARAGEPFVGRCVGTEGLRRIAAAFDAELIAMGYVTSKVSLPSQNLAAGVLTLRLHVGRVARMDLLDAGTRQLDAAWGTARNAFPVAAGDVLNIRDLEQGVEQMRRLPSQAVATELAPGQDADTSDVRILRRPASLAERTRGGITVDNSGNGALGRTQLSAYLSHDNPLGLNDVISFTLNTNVEQLAATQRSQTLAFNYSVPWGYNTFSVSRSRSRFAQVVQGTTVRFLSSGQSETAELRWSRTLLRTSAAKFGAYAALGTRRASSFLDDVELVVQRRRTTSFDTGINYKQLLGASSVELDVGLRRGVPWRNAQDDFPGAGEGGLSLRPKIWNLSATYQHPLAVGSRPVRLSTSLRAQHARQPTLSVDQIAIGGRHTVRGFDGESVLLAESGYVLRNEVAIALATPRSMDISAFAGLDVGRVWGPSAALLTGDRLAGAALGVRGHWKGLQFETSLATPLRKPEGFRTARWNPYLSASWIF